METLYQHYDIVHNTQHQLFVFTILIINWFLLYAIVHNTFTSTQLKPKLVLDTKNRIVSIVHGVLSFIMGAVEFIGADFNAENTQFQTFVCMFSLSYAIYDTIACTYYGLADQGLYIHHILCLFGFGAPIIYSYGSAIALGGLFVAEISNFPMHLRVLLRNYGLRYTKAYQFCENIYIGFYMFFRGIICPFFVFVPGIMAENSPYIPLFVCFGLTAQSIYYIIQMKKIIMKKIKNYQEMDQKKVKYYWLQENKQIQQLSFYKAKGGPKIF